MKLLWRLGGRLASAAVILLVLSLGLFHLLDAMPGRATDALLAASPELTIADAERILRVRGLDRGATERWACWLVGRGAQPFGADGRCGWWPTARGLVDGELGWSQVHKVPVSTILGERVLNTLRLTLPGLGLAVLASILFGALAARRGGRAADRAITGASFVALSLPSHWLALVAVLVFAVELRWLPPSGVRDPTGPATVASYVHHAVLPVSVLAFAWAGRWTRHVRAALLDALGRDFVVAARAKGLSETALLLRHALPNALFPLVTVVAQALPALFSGALVIERIFAYPGVGLLLYESVLGSDHLVAVVVFLVYAALTMASAAAADVLYAALDPKLRARPEAPR
ncbi:ABC transporter permease [Myxococcota bacterium]|nr:ABC transporter permease [Myxococcota bacterium]